MYDDEPDPRESTEMRRCRGCHSAVPLSRFAPLPEGYHDVAGDGIDICCRLCRAFAVARSHGVQ